MAAAMLATALSTPVYAADTEDEAILELIRLTGGDELGKQMAAVLLQQLKPAFPQVPEQLWTEFARELTSGELTTFIIPIYKKHFSLEELNGLIAFYATPLGKKVISEMPAIMQESMAVGSEWGRGKAAEILQRLHEKGFEPIGT
jgi:hypothetical protein